MSSKMLLQRYMGTDLAGGWAKFFEPGTSTAKVTFESDYSTAATTKNNDGVSVPITSDGWLKTYLLGDYDMDVFDKNGVQVSSADADGINPQETTTSSDINLAINGSFEIDSDGDTVPDNWVLTSYTGSTNAIVSSDQRHGQYSMSFTSVGSGGGFIVSSNFVLVDEDTNYNFAFSLISTAADVRNLVEILWYDEGFTSISNTTIYDDSTTNPTSWARYASQVTPPADAKHAKIRMYGCHSSDATVGTTRYDDVKFAAAELTSVSKPATHNANYTFILSDIWKTHLKTAADTTTRTWTIPLNATTPFPVGCTLRGENQDDDALTITVTGAGTLININGSTPADGDATIPEGHSFEAYQYAVDAWSIKVFRALTGLNATVTELNKNDDSAAAVSGYVSGMRAYIHKGGGEATAFAVHTNVTEGSFESVGPTGSGATNIWTAMDNITSGASFVKIGVTLTIQAPDTNVALIALYARQTGDATSASEANKVAIAHQNGSTSLSADYASIELPLDSSRRFDITWAGTNDSSRGATMYVRGFAL